MKKFYTLTVLLLLVTFSFVSCNKDKDGPRIKVTTPENNSFYSWGDNLIISATFTDDVDLAEYEVFFTDVDNNSTTDFNWQAKESISGTEQEYFHTLTVPQTAEDQYLINFKLTDAAGKEANSQRLITINQ